MRQHEESAMMPHQHATRAAEPQSALQEASQKVVEADNAVQEAHDKVREADSAVREARRERAEAEQRVVSAWKVRHDCFRKKREAENKLSELENYRDLCRDEVSEEDLLKAKLYVESLREEYLQVTAALIVEKDERDTFAAKLEDSEAALTAAQDALEKREAALQPFMCQYPRFKST